MEPVRQGKFEKKNDERDFYHDLKTWNHLQYEHGKSLSIFYFVSFRKCH